MTTNRRRLLKSAMQVIALAAMPTGIAAGKARPQRRLSKRAKQALDLRMKAAAAQLERPFDAHVTNGDETRHDVAWVCYSKGLPHESNGRAVPSACRQLWRAVTSGNPRDFEDVPLGGYIKLANPQAALTFDLVGPDPQQVTTPPPPAFSSAEQAAELVELYWHALLRDIPFTSYGTDTLARQAANELSGLAGFSGPRETGNVTSGTLFRGGTSGGRTGPYVSQFLWRDVPWTPIRVQQKIRIAAAGKDYLTTWDEWRNVQNGNVYPVNDYEGTPRYIRTARDLGEYVHRDFTYQAFLGACLILLRMNAALDGGMRYQYSVSQSGFVTLGPSDILHMVASVANLVLKATWYQKWVVHRRLRPEEYAGRLEQYLRGDTTYPFHSDLLDSTVLQLVRSRFRTALLPQAYPEGSPLHPSYPSGHAAIAGACATVLKACFAETFVIPNPQVPSEDGLTLIAYREGPLTVGGELDKLAENIAIGRNLAGIHWRTDASAGLLLGEALAIDYLGETRRASPELFDGFSLTRFDGTRIDIR